MKRLLILLILIYPVSALSHPGKTDRRGGHKCWKGCGEWELVYGEYHLHDKDFRPVRLNRKDKTAVITPMEYTSKPDRPDIPENADHTKAPMEVAGGNNEPAVKPQGETVTNRRYITTVYEENIFPFNPLYLFLTAILLLVALLISMALRNKKDR